LLLGLIVLIQVWGFMVCGALAQSAEGTDTARDTLTVCLPTHVDSFDPTDHRSRITQLVLKNIFEALTARDQDSRVIPLLAESWRPIDPTTWELELKKGVKFHDGSDFTARDVKFTFDRVIHPRAMDGRSSPRGELFEPVAGVEIVDDTTVRFITRRPWAILPMMLSLQEILPEQYFRSVGSEGFRQKPVGTGPFRLHSVPAGNRIFLTRYEHYRDSRDGGRPEGKSPLQNLIFEVVPQKMDQIARLKRGEADIIFSVPPSAVDILENTPGIVVSSQRPTRCYFAEINCAKAPFADRRIRQALNYAVDRSALVGHILGGHGKPLPTVLQREAFGYNNRLEPYPHDPGKARELLEAAGYPENRPVLIYSNDEDREIGSSIALFLTKIGLSVKVHVTASYRPETVGPDAEWDIFVGSWGNSTLDPIDILPPKFGSDGKGNYSGYKSQELDRLLDEAESAANMTERAEAYGRAQMIIYEDAPMIFGYASDELYGLRERVKNFHPSPTGMFELKDVYLEPGS
jgi:peptide/nickel transport system substrate-binding protein